jgi:hypothetical protein
VQVQMIDLVEGDLVEVLPDDRHGLEVTGHVEHRAAVGEAREVDDPAAGGGPRTRAHRGALDLRREELAQCLHAGEQPGGGLRPQHHGARGDVQLVALRADGGVGAGEQQRDAGGRFARPGRAHRQRVAGRAAQDVGQVVGHVGGAGGGVDGRVRRQRERRAGRRLHGDRGGHDVAQRGGRHLGSGGGSRVGRGRDEPGHGRQQHDGGEAAGPRGRDAHAALRAGANVNC